MKSAIVDGKRVWIGDSVGFKCDIEQSGTIRKIERNGGVVLTLTSQNGFIGEYIGGDKVTQVEARDCWVD